MSIAPVEWRQRNVDQFEATQTHLDGRQSQIHTGMPGVIVSFDPQTLTAVVQPAIQALQKNLDASVTPINITHIADVPVHFPGGGGHTLTFPVRPGDECWITFSERSIDNWHQQGSVQQPSDVRMHDINDAVAHVGLRSQVNLPAGGVSASTVQLRADDGNTFVDLDGAGNRITITAPQGITINAPFLHVTGAIVAGFGGGDQVGVQTHQHTQGTDSHGDSEAHTDPPIPGT